MKRPAQFSSRDQPDSLFPPAIFSDATYTHGIMVPNNDDQSSIESIRTEIPDDYFGSDRHSTRTKQLPYRYGSFRTEAVQESGDAKVRLLPVLSETEVGVWGHRNAAFAAAGRRFPMEINRFLGSITLAFEETMTFSSVSRGKSLEDVGLFSLNRQYSDRYRKRNITRKGIVREPLEKNSKFSRIVTPKQAMAEAMKEMAIDEGTSIINLPPSVQTSLLARSEQIGMVWKAAKNEPPCRECWNVEHGGFIREALEETSGEESEKDERHVPIRVLADWAKNEGNADFVVTDLADGRTASLYDGLSVVPTDATSIFEALLDLSDPTALYNVPLITPYAVARVEKDSDHPLSPRTWKIRIGVYANRLLFEVLTAQNLQIVMSVLDESSIVMKEPLHMPPIRKSDPVFVSSPYPAVVFGDESMPGKSNDDENMSVEEETKEDNKTLDVAVMGSSREESCISAFSPEGFLKLLENTGNDNSMWPAIFKSLNPYLKADIHLMLHQQHAVCWILQMENLRGFGINSILWEQREFLEGGSYFYSPALGQIRLGKPPDTRGGILADEMGLGKTLEMVSIIALTLHDLKRLAKLKGTQNTHATLLVVPPALAAQWMKEIGKFVGDNLSVELLDQYSWSVTKEIVSGVRDSGCGVDVLVTTYQALDQPKTSKFLAGFTWGRIVLDEMQEIRSSTTKIAKSCEMLKSARRWMLSGTPIFEGFDDLRGELNFLRLEPYAAKLEDGFFDFSIMNHMQMRSHRGIETLRILGLVMLRRSKNMTIHATGRSIMDQKKLKIEFIPIAQEPSERALYCWIEHIVDQELNHTEGEKDMQSRSLCLRLLREVCFSVVLLNGGLGVSSQLRTVNNLMVKAHRRAESEVVHSRVQASAKRASRPRILSPDEALRHIVQHQSDQNTREDFVSDQRFGQGQGASNRAHAMDSVEDQVKHAEDELVAKKKELASGTSRRSKARWHWALEKVTTGSMWKMHKRCHVKPKFSVLWRWRFPFSFGNKLMKENRYPVLLTRGWRPAPSLVKWDLFFHKKYAWAHPLALLLDNVPLQVGLDEIKEASYLATKEECQREILRAATLVEKIKESKNSEEIRKAEIIAKDELEYLKSHGRVMKKPLVLRDKNKRIYLQFPDEHDMRWFMRLATTKNGISVPTKTPVNKIESALKKAKESLRQAESQQKVYPCPANKKKENDARKALRRANLRLRILFTNVSKSSTNQITASRAVEPFRSIAPRTAIAQLNSTELSINESNIIIARAAAAVASGQKTIARLLPALKNGVSQEVAKMSAFETLEKLKEGAFDETRCPICLSHLGTATQSLSLSDSSPIVAMTSCGHFFCCACIDDHVHNQMRTNLQNNRNNGSVPCPNCRRPFSPSSDIIHINHHHNEKDERENQRRAAKKKVEEVAHLLENASSSKEGGFHIDGPFWKALYLSFDLPVGASNRAHPIYTAIPRDVLAHIRSATGMAADSSRAEKPIGHDVGLSSKLKWLLRDLPIGEHAVVFSSSKEGVLHIEAILRNRLVKCFSLFSGQNPKTSEEAVSNWEKTNCVSNVLGPVIVVQAGAAASGLTLTTASKIFLMEPFSRLKEEQQAYARCHRYGQRNDVTAKVYYVPVSVEARLLEWRKKSSKSTPQSHGDTNIVFTNLEESEEWDSDADTNSDNEEIPDESPQDGAATSNEDSRRTMFLLNLLDKDGNTIE